MVVSIKDILWDYVPYKVPEDIFNSGLLLINTHKLTAAL
jgi:hypothetical protein